MTPSKPVSKVSETALIPETSAQKVDPIPASTKELMESHMAKGPAQQILSDLQDQSPSKTSEEVVIASVHEGTSVSPLQTSEEVVVASVPEDTSVSPLKTSMEEAQEDDISPDMSALSLQHDDEVMDVSVLPTIPTPLLQTSEGLKPPSW